MDSTERLIQSGVWANVPMKSTINLVSSNSRMMILLSSFCSLGLWLGDLQHLWLRSINSLLRKSFQAFKIKLMDENDIYEKHDVLVFFINSKNRLCPENSRFCLDHRTLFQLNNCCLIYGWIVIQAS
jgi:hypothetical protein